MMRRRVVEPGPLADPRLEALRRGAASAPLPRLTAPLGEFARAQADADEIRLAPRPRRIVVPVELPPLCTACWDHHVEGEACTPRVSL